MVPPNVAAQYAPERSRNVDDEARTPADGTLAAIAIIRIRHVLLAAHLKCYISFAPWRKGNGDVLLQLLTTVHGRFRPIAAAQQYVRGRTRIRHCTDIANRSSLTRTCGFGRPFGLHG